MNPEFIKLCVVAAIIFVNAGAGGFIVWEFLGNSKRDWSSYALVIGLALTCPIATYNLIQAAWQ